MAEQTSKLEERFHGIGNIIVCLHYLAGEARKSKLDEVATHLDQVIIQAARLGQEEYKTYISQAINDDKSVQGFIDQFCPVADENIKFGLTELIFNTLSPQGKR